MPPGAQITETWHFPGSTQFEPPSSKGTALPGRLMRTIIGAELVDLGKEKAMLRLFLAIAVLGSEGRPPELAATQPLTLKEKANSAIVGVAPYMLDFLVVPGLEIFSLCDGSNSDLENFPDELMHGLRSDDPQDRQASLHYLATLGSFIRTAAWKRDRDEGDDLVRVALCKYAGPVESALKGVLKKAKGEEAIHAAIALLALEPRNQDAIAALTAEIKGNEPAHRIKACEAAAGIRASQPEVIAALKDALADKNTELRCAAALAIRNAGSKAAETVPALVELLKTGDAAVAAVQPFGMLPPPRKNVALLALAAMGDAAHQAVPTIAKRLAQVDAAEQFEYFDCLARLGRVAKESCPALEKAMVHGPVANRIYAAVALLAIDPSNSNATKIVLTSLTGGDPEAIAHAVRACAKCGPKAKALVAPLAAILKHEKQEICEAAVSALGRMGPAAEPAIPALITLLRDKKDDDVRSHFLAAVALADIGKASVPALLRVLQQADSTGRRGAAIVLGRVGKGCPDVVPALVKALDNEPVEIEKFAAQFQLKNKAAIAKLMQEMTQAASDASARLGAVLALGQLKDQASDARRALTRVVAQDRGRVFYDIECAMAAWALTQLDRKTSE
jgi:HEAT repeat protein